MNIKCKKGYALIAVMVFVIISTIASFALYVSVENLTKEIRIQEVGYIRGYYAAIAGLRYAAILLRDPEGNLEFTNSGAIETFSTDNLVIGDTQYQPFINFCSDINTDQAHLIITITERNPSGGPYDSSATCRY